MAYSWNTFSDIGPVMGTWVCTAGSLSPALPTVAIKSGGGLPLMRGEALSLFIFQFGPDI